MKHAIACLCCLSLMSTSMAAADCAEEVNAAWGRLRSTPFAFEIVMEAPAVPRIAGAFIWPSSMRYQTQGPNGPTGVIVIGPRHWHYVGGQWVGGEEHRTTSASYLGLHWTLFGLGTSADSAACLGSVVRDGRDYVTYEYKLPKSFMGGNYTEHQRLYVDTQTGLPARLEVEREHKAGKIARLPCSTPILP